MHSPLFRRCTCIVAALVLSGCAARVPAKDPLRPTASAASCRQAFAHAAEVAVMEAVLTSGREIPTEWVLDRAVENYVHDRLADGELPEFMAWCTSRPPVVALCIRSAHSIEEMKACEYRG